MPIPQVISPHMPQADFNRLVSQYIRSSDYTVHTQISGVGVGNVGTGLDLLMSFDLPGGTLTRLNHGLRISTWGTTANNSNTKTISLRLDHSGGNDTLMVLGAAAFDLDDWYIEAVVVRSAFTAAECGAIGQAGSSLGAVSESNAVKEQSNADWDGVVTVSVYGQTLTSSDDDILAHGLVIHKFSA